MLINIFIQNKIKAFYVGNSIRCNIVTCCWKL